MSIPKQIANAARPEYQAVIFKSREVDAVRGARIAPDGIVIETASLSPENATKLLEFLSTLEVASPYSLSVEGS